MAFEDLRARQRGLGLTKVPSVPIRRGSTDETVANFLEKRGRVSFFPAKNDVRDTDIEIKFTGPFDHVVFISLAQLPQIRNGAFTRHPQELTRVIKSEYEAINPPNHQLWMNVPDNAMHPHLMVAQAVTPIRPDIVMEQGKWVEIYGVSEADDKNNEPETSTIGILRGIARNPNIRLLHESWNGTNTSPDAFEQDVDAIEGAGWTDNLKKQAKFQYYANRANFHSMNVGQSVSTAAKVEHAQLRLEELVLEGATAPSLEDIRGLVEIAVFDYMSPRLDRIT